MSLDTKNLKPGDLVQKIKGVRAGEKGRVRYIDIGTNRFDVWFNNDKEPTLDCDPGEFIRLDSVKGTVPRGSL